MKLKTTFSAPLLILLVMLLFGASRYIDFGRLAYQENICLAIIVLQLVVLLVPSMFYIKVRGEGFTSRLRLAPFGIEKLLVTLLALVTLLLGDMLLKLLLVRIGGGANDYANAAFSVYTRYLGGTEPGVLYSLITFAVLPAIAEELLFRSILCTEYEGNGIAAAVVGSAALYGMFSMDFGSFLLYFFAGVIYALVLYLTKSIFLAMICHFLNNLFTLAAGETVYTIITKPQSTGFLVFILTGFFLLCLAALFSECERIYYGYSLAGMSADYVNPGAGLRTFLEAILAPPLLAAAVIFLVAAIQFG